MFVKTQSEPMAASQISVSDTVKIKTNTQNNSKIEDLLIEQLSVAHRENGLLLEIIKNLSYQK